MAAEKVVDEDVPKVVEEEKEAAVNGAAKVTDEAVEAVVAEAVVAENGSAPAADDATPVVEDAAVDSAPAVEAVAATTEEAEKIAEVVEATNGDSTGKSMRRKSESIVNADTGSFLSCFFCTDAPTEAVKRKVEEESAETVDDGESVPEKKAKLAAAAEESNGDAVEEVTA